MHIEQFTTKAKNLELAEICYACDISYLSLSCLSHLHWLSAAEYPLECSMVNIVYALK